mgnify:CR=1 FL=1
MSNRRRWLTVLIVLILVLGLLTLVGCGQEEGKKARETVDVAGREAVDFAEGFCGAIILAPLFVGLATISHRPH